jgi:hypothetical protein
MLTPFWDERGVLLEQYTPRGNPITSGAYSAEIGNSSVDWVQVSRFHLKTETESSLRNVCVLNKNRTVDNVEKHNECINILSSQIFRP